MTETQLELITWLIAVVPQKYMPPSVLKALEDLKVGSGDGFQEVLEDYVLGTNKLGYDFKLMTREQIIERSYEPDNISTVRLIGSAGSRMGWSVRITQEPTGRYSYHLIEFAPPFNDIIYPESVGYDEPWNAIRGAISELLERTKT